MQMSRVFGIAVALCLFGVTVSAGAAESPSKSGPMKVAFIITDPLSGSAWTQAWNTAREQLEKALHVQTIVAGPAPENNQVATQAVDLIGQGYNVIVAEDFSYQAFLHSVAERYPNVRFILIGPNIEKPLPNVSTVYGNLWQVRYVEGVLAGLTTKTGKLGFVTAHTIPSVVAGINGFHLGAQSVNPRVTTYVIQTGQWYDPAGATQAAQTLAARGADVIAQHEDDTGALLGAQQARVWEMGSEADTSAVAPKTYLSGSVYNWGPYLIDQVKRMEAGTWKASNYSGDLKSGLVSLGPINPAVPAKDVSKVKETIAAINGGSLEVFKGPIDFNDGKVMVPAGQVLSGPGEIYPKQTGFVKGIVGKIKG
jgi:basic membrane protein A and related proteins